jgi:hypothetical protein
MGSLKLPTFLREYEKVAAEAAREGLDHVRFLCRTWRRRTSAVWHQLWQRSPAHPRVVDPMTSGHVELKSERMQAGPSSYGTEYKALHDQRLMVIRSYNMWYAFGHVVAHAYFWLLLFVSLDLSSRPLLIAAAVTASLIVLFAYRVIRIIDRDVVRLYPRIVFLELMMGSDFYRDYLKNRPRGDTERSFIEKAERMVAGGVEDLWEQIYSQFKEQDFPADRRITAHFKSAAYFSIALFWIVVGMILLPPYFPWTG